jgi:GNAT superfamily N-acetyltransferase
VEYRRASEADLKAEFDTFVAAQAELHTRRGAVWTPRPYDPAGSWAAVHRHLLTHDGERSYVADDQGRVAGFTAALVRGDCWYFSALFVHPDFQGRGIGARLLDLAWGGGVARRITITEAIQPVSNTLYARRGMLPLTPLLSLQGRPEIAEPEGLEPAAPWADALHSLDLAAYGFDRAVDHELWMRTCPRATLWLRGGEPVAYSYLSPYGIGPVVGRDPASAAQALQYELARSSGQEVAVNIPGSAVDLVAVALRAGLRFLDPGLLLVAPAQDPPPTALAIHSYWLY